MRHISLVIALLLITAPVHAEPVQWPASAGGNDHWYEVLGGPGTAYDGVEWTAADWVAKGRSYMGLRGHLATVTTSAEELFIRSLPGVACGFFAGDPPCADWHVGGWSIITGIIDPQPYDPPYVETAGEYWITGEAAGISAPAVSSVTGPVGDTIYFRLGMYSLDNFGYPDYGLHAVGGPSTAAGFIVEYDGLPATTYPDNTVATTESTWGNVKALYR